MDEPYQEFWAADGEPRAHQRLLWERLQGLSAADRTHLEQVVKRRVREQEVTFNIFGLPNGDGHEWGLDWLPAVLAPSDFASLAQGLRQRAQLLDDTLDDLYGARRLLRERVLPPGLVLGNPRYLRIAHGWKPAHDRRLILYAADVGRGPDGRFAVFSDRTAAPTGYGFALQNRMVVGRTLAGLFRRYPVAKSDGFFSTVSRALHALTPEGKPAPRIVVLTAGASDESAFEHAYLASYLGFDLVEGGDLVVRDGSVYLKALSGLQKVDVILRRVFDSWCDPLHLRGDSLLGVPGLMEAARAGTVGIANPIGSTLLESPAFKAYLPALAEALLGAPLELDSVPTRWCGDPRMFEEVLDTLEDWSLKPAFEERRASPLQLASLGAAAREQALTRIRREPHRWVAERWPVPSRTVVAGDLQSSASLTVRTFVCHDPESREFIVMPGGLGRLDASPDALFIDPGGDRLTKDVWVPDLATVRLPELPQMPEGPTTLLRGGVELPSRLLDDIYWLGRYVQRCETTARLVRLALDQPIDAGPELTQPLYGALQATLQQIGILQVATAPSSEEELYRLVLGEGKAAENLAACVRRVHALSDSVRVRLSREAWETLQRFRTVLEPLQAASDADFAECASEQLQTLLLLGAAVRGSIADGMVHSDAWSFLELGLRIERAVDVTSTMQAFLPIGSTTDHLRLLLEACDSVLTYRARYLTRFRVSPVVDLLLCDMGNPRSVLFQVRRLARQASRLPRQSAVELSAAERRLILLEAQLGAADVFQLCGGDGEELRRLFSAVLVELGLVSDELARQYFSHTATSATNIAPQWTDTEAP